MVADARSTARTDDELNWTLHTIYCSFGDVRSSTDLISLL